MVSCPALGVLLLMVTLRQLSVPSLTLWVILVSLLVKPVPTIAMGVPPAVEPVLVLWVGPEVAVMEEIMGAGNRPALAVVV